jgi:hypothetical protein
LIVDSLSLQNHAVGETILSGRCNDAVMNNQSVGNFDAKQFHCQEIHLINSAVGNASITADEAFYVTNSGVGHLTLYGKGIVKELQDNGISKTQRDDN